MAEEMKVEFGAHAEGLIGAMSQIRFALEGLSNPIRAVRNNLGELAEAFLAAFAVEKITEWFEKFTEVGEEIEHMSHEVGMSTESISKLNVAFAAMGLGSNEAGRAFERLERNMTEAQTNANGPAAQSFRALGISMQQLQTMSPEEMLNRLADEFSRTADGPNKTAIAMNLLGRAGAEMIPFLDKGREGLAQFNAMAERTGYVFTNGMAENAENAKVAMTELSYAWSGLMESLYEGLVKYITPLIQGFATLVEKINNLLHITDQAKLNHLMDQMDSLRNKMAEIDDQIDKAQKHKYPPGQMFGFGVNIEKLKREKEEIIQQYSSLQDQYQEIYDKMYKESHGDKDKPQAPNPAKFQLGMSPDIMQQYRSDLVELESAQQNYFESTKNMDQSFWAERLALAEQGKAEINGKIVDIKQYYIDNGEQEVQAARKATEMKIALEQQVYSARRQAASEWLSQYEQGIQTQLSDLKNQLATKGISEQQWYEQSIQLENDRIQILRQLGLQDTSAYQQAVRQRMNTDKQLIADEERQWKQFANTISSAFNSSLRGMLQGTETFAQGMKQMMGNLILDWIEKFAKAKIEWVGTQIAMALANDEKNASITASDAAAAAAKSAAGAAAHAEDKKSILSDAAVAFGNVFKWVSAIPYVGPVLAPPAAAAAYAAVVAMDTLIPSAAGGMVVPDDTLAMVHKNEMVLPAHLSQGIQGIIGGGSNTIGGGGVVNVNFNINALDAAGVSNLLKVQGPTIAKVIQEQVRINNQSFQGTQKAVGR